MTREEAIIYGQQWDAALAERGDEQQSDARSFLAWANIALQSPAVFLTDDDLRLIRKVLSCVNTLYTVAEPEYKENKIDLLLRKLRNMGID